MVEIYAEATDNGLSLGIAAQNEDYVTAAQMEILKNGMERYILAANGYGYPEVSVNRIAEDKMSFAEEIAFYLIAFILYLFILLCGSIITSSVALEKTSRVSELIIYRVSVLKLIYSKVLALYSIIIMILAGVTLEFGVAVATRWIDISAVQALLEIVGFGAKEIAIVIGIIITGIMVYTVLYIFVGTMIKSADQIQFSQLPVAAIVLIGFMITILCRQNSDSMISRICTIVYLVVGNYLIVNIYKKENR